HGVTGGASRAHDITVPRRLSSAYGGCVEGMFPDVNEMGLSDRGAEDVVGPTLPRIAIDHEAGQGVQEREGEPEQFRDVSHHGLRKCHGSADGSHLEADDELSNRGTEDRLEKGGVHEEDDSSEDPVHPGSSDALHVQERPERSEDGRQVDEIRDDAFDPVDLERAVVTDQVEAAHHERIPPFRWGSRY